MRVRTDLQSEGLFFVKTWLLKLIPQFEAYLTKAPEGGDDASEDSYVDKYEFASFADDFVPFIAKNQFKQQIRKHAPLPKKDSIQERIALIMNPMEMFMTKDHVKVLIQIVPKTERN